MVRECFPESVLLGSVDHPVEITETCNPVSIESDGSIKACICRQDFCNGLDESLSPPGLVTRPDSQQVLAEIDIESPEDGVVVSTEAPESSRLMCHQCGSLFSNKNSDCQIFDETDKTQKMDKWKGKM